MFINRALIEGALPPRSTYPVAHYTRIGTLRHFISDTPPGWGSAWATPVQFLNDRKELSLGLGILREVANQRPLSGQIVRSRIDYLLETFGDAKTDAFQMSFSGNSDELGQWRGYAANGMGCSIVTDPLQISLVADVAGWVLYEGKKQRAFARTILEGLRNERDIDLIGQVLVAAASYMKHEGFEPEMEFRLLKFPDPSAVEFRESGDRLVPYIDYLKGVTALPVSKILIGPGWQLANLQPEELLLNHVVQGIQRLLTARGLHTTDIESSAIPYDPK